MISRIETICATDENKIDAVLWPYVNASTVWLFVYKYIFTYDLITLKPSSTMISVDDMFPGLPNETQITGASSSYTFEGNSTDTKHFYTYLVLNHTDIHIFKHRLPGKCSAKCILTKGEPIDQIKVPCITGKPSAPCFFVIKSTLNLDQKDAYYFFYIAIDSNKYLKRAVHCKNGITPDGGYDNSSSSNSSCFDYQGTIMSIKPFVNIDFQPLEICRRIDLPMRETGNKAFSSYFAVGQESVRFKAGSTGKIILPIYSVLGCGLPFQSDFNLYSTGTTFSLLLCLITFSALAGILIYDLNNLYMAKAKKKMLQNAVQKVRKEASKQEEIKQAILQPKALVKKDGETNDPQAAGKTMSLAELVEFARKPEFRATLKKIHREKKLKKRELGKSTSLEKVSSKEPDEAGKISASKEIVNKPADLKVKSKEKSKEKLKEKSKTKSKDDSVAK